MFKTIGSMGTIPNDRPLTPEEQKIVDDYHQLTYRIWNEGRHTMDLSWFGFPLLKNPYDLWIYQEIITQTLPELFVETGTLWGGSALYFASLFELLGIGEVVTIDRSGADTVINEEGKTVGEIRPKHPLITYHAASSVDPDTVDMVAQRSAGKRTMVFLDANHTRDHVIQELRAYAPIVTVGCYMIAEDANVNGHPVYADHGPGPYEAVEAFLKENDDFVIDHHRERLMVTSAPHGFLKKVKESWTPDVVMGQAGEALDNGDAFGALHTLIRGAAKYPDVPEITETLALLREKLGKK